jgi:hypothetical protein
MEVAGHERTFGPLKVSSNEMCDLGNAIHLEFVDCFLRHAIGVCDTFVLAQMLQPRF